MRDFCCRAAVGTVQPTTPAPAPSSRGACLDLVVRTSDNGSREVSSALQGLLVVLSLNQLEAHEGRGLEYQVLPPGTPYPTVQFSCSVVSYSLRPHGLQPTGHPRPWDSPGKNTGVGCHFILQCMKVKSQS